jgi:hypothetical protein
MGGINNAEARKRGHTNRRKSWTGKRQSQASTVIRQIRVPRDAVARIYKPFRSVMTSGLALLAMDRTMAANLAVCVPEQKRNAM